MDKDDNTIKSIIDRYLNKLKINDIKVEKAFLFGSYAKGSANEHSDIDLAIISNDFIGSRFLDRRKLVPLRRDIDVRLEPMPFRPDDFVDDDPLVIEIMTSGISLEIN